MLWFFGIIMGLGLLYLLSVILGGLGDFLDFDIDGTLESLGLAGLFGIEGANLDALDGIDDVGGLMNGADASADAQSVGCLAIASFMAMFGAVGLVGVLTDRSLWVIVIVGVVFSYVIARLVTEALKYVCRQQGNDAFSTQDLVGKTARVTIRSGEGQTGEVLVEAGRMLKYPVKEVEGRALTRGDEVRIIGVQGRYLEVQKITS